MKIDLTKKYKTVTGLQVKLYDVVDSTQKYCVIGAIYGAGGIWRATSWDASGNNIDGDYHNLTEIPDFAVVRSEQIYSETFEYFEIKIILPKNIKWLATDYDGNLYGYFSEPYLTFGNYWDSDGDCVKIAKIKFKGDYKQSKLQVA